ncbi:SDR family NAD(P)-dependent oxidoreductase [Spirillospora sp. NPDC047279]|uniref:SDR family NAD(P)-dependent oxidoreductase n=1 Tax=Spirillospora sp. NPDC047279 TaxID=3155478 RepID=UPI0033E21E3B
MAGAVIIGAGPGIGRSVALRFAREGQPIALIARNERNLKDMAPAVSGLGVQVTTHIADTTDEPALRSALDAAIETHGLPDAVIYNAAIIQQDTAGQLSAQGHLDAWAVNVVGALTAAAHIAPLMAERGNGSFIITSGMPEPKRDYVSLSLGKSGVRTLVTLLDQEYGPSGVHLASVTVAGPVAPGTDFAPDDIADHYWRLHTQPRGNWRQEALHNARPQPAPAT